ncbi:MAG: efflux RND transporter periplasmic adaptor subunit [Bacteroidia bacterium]|nr:efflux RND transporter periplasmic adaptor subunit [Bacteroidia bacterium]
MAKKKKRTWLIIASIILIGLLIAAAIYKSKSKPKGEEITTEKVSMRTIKETVSASGRIFPEKEVKISSDVSGEIVELFVMEGDSVLMGQILANIDPESYESAVARSEAAVSGAKSQLAISKSNKENSIAQKAQISAQLKNATKILARNSQLLRDGIISQAEYDQAVSNVENLEANLQAADANIRSAEQSIESAKFNVESAEASLKEMQTSLKRTTIEAPVNGIVSSLSVEQGERVVGTMQMSGTEMMRIANLNSMEVQVDVSENDIIRVGVGDLVDIEVDAFLDKIFKGTVTEIANSASNISSGALNTDQVTNFIVKIRINPESYNELVVPGQRFPFRPGMSASVDIYTNEKNDILSVPIQAVTAREIDPDEDDEKDEKEFKEVVFVFSADTVSMKEVKTGIQDDEYIEILEGLGDEDEVVTGPYKTISSKLEDGEEAHIKKEDKDKDKDKKKNEN